MVPSPGRDLDPGAAVEATGHTSDANLETYLAGVDHYPLAKAGQEALEGQFRDLLAEAEDGGNARRFAGVTGRAARKRDPR